MERRKLRMKLFKETLLEMNRIYHTLKGKENITIEAIKEISSFDFSDNQYEMLLKDLNEN